MLIMIGLLITRTLLTIQGIDTALITEISSFITWTSGIAEWVNFTLIISCTHVGTKAEIGYIYVLIVFVLIIFAFAEITGHAYSGHVTS